MYIKMYIFLDSELYIFLLIMKIMRCIICEKDLEKFDVDICKTCFDVLKIKYPKYNKFMEVIKWHKKYQKQKE